MSANPRCHDCNHKRGPRVTTGPIANPDNKRGHEGGHPKKNPCACRCHGGET